VDDVRVPKAGVQRGGARDPLQRAVDRPDGEALRLLRACLEVWLVELHDVRARGEQVAHLLVHGLGQRHRERFLVVVVVVLRLLRHRERSWQCRFDLAVGVGAQELHVPLFDGSCPPNRPDHARNRVRVTGPVECRPRMVQVHSLQRRRESVGVALAPDLPVGDDVDPGPLHVTDGD